jgi:ABC-type glycerol-3-phosphate transport system substrate-binding protein
MNIYDTFNSGKLGMAIDPEYPQPSLPFEVDLVPYPYGPSNPNKAVFVYPQAWSVPTGAKNPQGAAAFAYLMNTLTKQNYVAIETKRYGEENFNILNDPDINLVYSMDKGLSNIWFLIASVVNHMYDQIPPATIAEKINPMIESEIVKVYGEQAK